MLAGEPSAHRDIAVLNAAAALTVVGRVPDLAAGVALAGQVIDDGTAASRLDAFVQLTGEAAAAEAAAGPPTA